jgi:hypothetical protein
MIPTINFKFSWIYDSHWKDLYEKEGREKKFGKYPSHTEILEYIKKVEILWSSKAENVLQQLQEITNLKWKLKQITCYVVGWAVPFSDPLTLPMYKDYPDYFIDTLIHELIHQLFIQNDEKLINYWKFIDKKYKKEDFDVRVHIPLHALHKKIYLSHFDAKRIKRDKDMVKHLKTYTRSWEIVEREGYESIIMEFKSQIKK